MNASAFYSLVFWLLATVTIVSAAAVALTRNIVHSAFALMGTLLGVAGLYLLLAADFVAVVHVLIYVGGILVLTLFAVMLTHSAGDVRVANRSLGRWPALLVIGAVFAVMVRAVTLASWAPSLPVSAHPTTAAIGDEFLSAYLLPFELASVVLLAALIGAVMLSRKELR